MEQTQRGEEEREDEKKDIEGKPARPQKGGDGARSGGTTLHKTSEAAKASKQAEKQD